VQAPVFRHIPSNADDYCADEDVIMLALTAMSTFVQSIHVLTKKYNSPSLNIVLNSEC